MPKITVTMKMGQFETTIQADTQKEAFFALAEVSEILKHHTCGRCSGPTAPMVRNVSGYTYAEMQCQNSDCGYRWEYGFHKEQPTLFPRHKGWVKPWTPTEGPRTEPMNKKAF